MNLNNSIEPQLIKVSNAAKLLQVSPSTLRRMDTQGIINSTRSDNGFRYYKMSDVQQLLNNQIQNQSQTYMTERQLTTPIQPPSTIIKNVEPKKYDKQPLELYKQPPLSIYSPKLPVAISTLALLFVTIQVATTNLSQSNTANTTHQNHDNQPQNVLGSSKISNQYMTENPTGDNLKPSKQTTNSDIQEPASNPDPLKEIRSYISRLNTDLKPNTTAPNIPNTNKTNANTANTNSNSKNRNIITGEGILKTGETRLIIYVPELASSSANEEARIFIYPAGLKEPNQFKAKINQVKRIIQIEASYPDQKDTAFKWLIEY